MPLEAKRRLIELHDEQVSIRRQCELVGMNRSSLYYKPRGESDVNLKLMRLIDEQYTRMPYYGSPRMTAWLCRQGYHVNHKRVERLMAIMGLEAIHPGPNTSKRHHAHKIYPYLLSGVKVVRPNQVWSTDITYIRMAYGFIYLLVIMDWFSRYVLSWRVSITLDVDFCMEALDAALAINRPEIFNSDQGCQFTSKDFTGRLEDEGIRISMDGRGRVFDNIFVERLWRSVKYEEVYLKDYRTVKEAIQSLGAYFELYNTERLHQSLAYRTPREVYG
jgi:putative transposase